MSNVEKHDRAMSEDWRSFTEARDFIKREMAQRVAKDPYYSLRRFAADLEIAVSSLSDILRGKQGLSQRKAEFLANKLGLSDEEKELFYELVNSHFSRSQARRDIAQQRLRRLRYFQSLHKPKDGVKENLVGPLSIPIVRLSLTNTECSLLLEHLQRWVESLPHHLRQITRSDEDRKDYDFICFLKPSPLG